jgi:lipoate-protein ligase A
VKLIHTHNLPIFEQLQLEEALVRCSDENWCLINEGSPPAVVMGISGIPEQLIDFNHLGETPVIKRFSGGGTVIVDDATLFVTFIFAKAFHPFPAYPEPILNWSAEIFAEAFKIPDFALRENDFVIGARKCGGNAQYIKRERWLHHTSFLWDYNPDRMKTLLHPPKTPPYRQGRSHEEFLCRLKEFAPSKQTLVTALKSTLASHYAAEEVPLDTARSYLDLPHRKSVKLELTKK